MPRLAPLIVVLAALLSGCDALTGALGIQMPEKVAAERDAEGKAIGGACRQAGRAIEDCYVLNKKADKAGVLAGWRDMNDYMRENKIEAVVPQLTPTTAAQLASAEAKAAEAKAAEGDGAKAADADKPAAKGKDAGRSRSAKAHDS
jgi:hypothetical protein